MNFVDYLFEKQKYINREFIVGNSEKLTYSELYDLTFKTANWLYKTYGENNKILLISENSSFFVVTYLGIIASGNICVPVNPAISSDSLSHIIQQCEIRIGFVHMNILRKFKHFPIVIYDNKVFSLIGNEKNTPLYKNFDSTRVAEILYTSGSTSLPKGVMLTHRNLIANTESIISYLHLSSSDRIEVVLPFYYCYGLSLLHTHIRVGGSIVLNNTFILLNTVIDDLLKYQCTGFAGVPSHFQILLRKSKKFKTTKFPNLKYVTQAGGKLPNVFIKEFVQIFPDVKFYVMYGQTEATARLSYLPPELVLKKLGSIGMGIPGVKLEVLNEDGQPVRPGEIGTIVASGDNIMLGYFKEKELTQKTIRNGKLFTGDLGTVDEDGFIYLVARENEFLKVGGERISPKEIEEVIVSIPEVVDCSILGVPDEILGEAIKAFIVLDGGANLSEEAIRGYCEKRLSSNKIPKYIYFVDHIPMNATGKKTKATIMDLNESIP